VVEKAGYSQTGQLNVAVVGLGWWGKAIIGELKNNNKLCVARAVDIAPASADWARAENIPFTDDYSAVLADPAIGAVVLTTPHTQHRAQVVAAAQAKKHVFCEKPLALTRADAVAEVEACKANNVVLAVGHEHRFKQAIVDILRMVRSGELGTIQMTEATLTFELRPFAADNWRIQKSEAPGGPSMTALGIHGLDLCVAVNGPAQSVTANMSSLISDKSETLGIMIRFKNGANAMLSSLFGPPFSIRFAVFGSKGWAEVRDKTHPQAPTGWVLIRGKHGAPQETIEYPAVSIVRANLEAFADAAAGRAAYPVAHEEMIANIAAFEAIAKSADTGKTVMVEN
jgi:predicted dehydrogenase